jgi:hypothetical protein
MEAKVVATAAVLLFPVKRIVSNSVSLRYETVKPESVDCGRREARRAIRVQKFIVVELSL